MTRIHLIADTEGDLGAASGALEELLLALEADEALYAEGDRWIAAVAIAQGAEALGRINLARARAEGDPAVRLVAPDGRFELVPLVRVPLDEEDVAALGLAVAMLGESLLAGGNELIAGTIRMEARSRSPRRRAGSGEDPGREVVARAAALHAVYELTAGEDTGLLLARLPVSGGLVLDATALAAYKRLTGRFLSIWTLDSEGRPDPLDRFLFDGGGRLG